MYFYSPKVGRNTYDVDYICTAIVIIFFGDRSVNSYVTGGCKAANTCYRRGGETFGKFKGCGSMHSRASHKGKSTEKIRKTA